jgi:hypothetical protein
VLVFGHWNLTPNNMASNVRGFGLWTHNFTKRIFGFLHESLQPTFYLIIDALSQVHQQLKSKFWDNERSEQYCVLKSYHITLSSFVFINLFLHSSQIKLEMKKPIKYLLYGIWWHSLSCIIIIELITILIIFMKKSHWKN